MKFTHRKEATGLRPRGAAMSDDQVETLLTAARPDPAPLAQERVDRIYRNVLAAAPGPAAVRRAGPWFAPARLALATAALGCAIALAWYGAGAPDVPLGSAVPPVSPVVSREPPVKAGAPVASEARPVARRTAPARLAGFHPAPSRQASRRLARLTERGSRPSGRGPAPVRAAARAVDASLAQILVVSATDPLPRVTVEPAPAEASEYTRVAVYTPGPEGGVASECTIRLSPAGEESVRYAAQADAGQAEAPYLSVEVTSSAAEAPAADAGMEPAATVSEGGEDGAVEQESPPSEPAVLTAAANAEVTEQEGNQQ